ncbi:sporulation protein [Caldibacillus lycopersici]|uniref:Sporulation protein n=1 Tax=Perspicuibacillus lycopersici TaxID=1325689 RepID=A0AAE3ITP2_9BACI|nr:sporulation membrane protein YtrI [Perspicuibacillus lycopersici]MCU9614197.1 sporulation protein [Perspicuibacillus lycopersici]
MRVPPYYRSPNWQRVFFGVVIGAIISWCVFLFMFGKMQEKQAQTIHKQEELIAELEKEKNIWQEDYKKLNDKNLELLTVQEIVVKLTNANKYHIDSLSEFQVTEDIKEDINMVLAKDLNLVFNSRELLKKAIENRPVRINNKRYKLIIREMVIYTTLIIRIELEIAE